MYVITGATGHTGHRVAEQLLAAGQPVRAISRSAEKLSDLTAKGAEAAVGDLSDAAFLTAAFRGATAVYLMVPPKWDVQDWRAYQRTIIHAFVQALGTTGVRKAVLLSSVGAHLLEGAGPVSGLAELEQALRQVPNLDVLSLRAGFFMENFYGNVDLIKQANLFGYNLRADVAMPIVHTRDIADVAARRLLALDFEGHTHIFVSGADDLTMPEVAATIGRAIGKPDLAYVHFDDEAARQGMLQAGLPETIANGYVELFQALNSGIYQEGYARKAEETTPTTVAWFAENELRHAF